MIVKCPNCQQATTITANPRPSRCQHCQEMITLPTSVGNQITRPDFEALREMRRARLARQQKNKRQEIIALERAVRYDPLLITAHIRLGRIHPDKKVRRRHLMAARRIDPNNMEAITLLAHLQSAMSPKEALKLFGDDAPIKETKTAKTKTKVLHCPVCRGALSSSPKDGLLECNFCGYSERYEQQSITERTVREQVAQNISSTQWIVDEHVSSCENCSAQWLHQKQLNTICPYCNSQQLVINDSFNSFIQPDGLIPFEINEQKALTAIQKRLNSFGERLKAIINPNAIKRAIMNAVYLPFWVFELDINIHLQINFDLVGFKKQHVQRDTARTSAYELAIPAINSIPDQMTQQLGRYNRITIQAYRPDILDHPAEIYDFNINEAMFRARPILARAITTRVEGYQYLYSTDFSTTNFQLVLAPVWLVTIHEVDNEVRSVLVNGQTGKVILGKSRHSE